MKRLKTGPVNSESKQKLIVIVNDNEKISSFRNAAKAGRTTKRIAKALRCGVPVAIRKPAK
jgi:hypothetical protein